MFDAENRGIHPAVLIILEVVFAVVVFVVFFYFVLPALFDLVSSYQEVVGEVTGLSIYPRINEAHVALGFDDSKSIR